MPSPKLSYYNMSSRSKIFFGICSTILILNVAQCAPINITNTGDTAKWKSANDTQSEEPRLENSNGPTVTKLSGDDSTPTISDSVEKKRSTLVASTTVVAQLIPLKNASLGIETSKNITTQVAQPENVPDSSPPKIPPVILNTAEPVKPVDPTTKVAQGFPTTAAVQKVPTIVPQPQPAAIKETTVLKTFPPIEQPITKPTIDDYVVETNNDVINYNSGDQKPSSSIRASNLPTNNLYNDVSGEPGQGSRLMSGLVIISLVVLSLYLLYHNKRRVVALLVEGCPGGDPKPSRAGPRTNGGGPDYTPLTRIDPDDSAEDVIYDHPQKESTSKYNF